MRLDARNEHWDIMNIRGVDDASLIQELIEIQYQAVFIFEN